MNRILKSIANEPALKKFNLTVSHSRKFLWFRVAKVGTGSIRHALKQISSEIYKPAATWVDYDPVLFVDYYKFAFVRNPWDRLVSCWLDKVCTRNYFGFDPDGHTLMERNFSRFVEFVSTKNLYNCDQHLQLQTELIILHDLDMLGRMENFDEDAQKVFATINLQGTKASIKNQSTDRLHYREYYSDALKRKVGDLYQQDIELLEYEF